MNQSSHLEADQICVMMLFPSASCFSCSCNWDSSAIPHHPRPPHSTLHPLPPHSTPPRIRPRSTPIAVPPLPAFTQVEGMEVHLDEGGVTKTRGGWQWCILPAGCKLPPQLSAPSHTNVKGNRLRTCVEWGTISFLSRVQQRVIPCAP